MISLAALGRRVERLFKEADDIQDEWSRRNDMPTKKLNRMNRLYAEASAISMTLEAAEAELGGQK